MNDNNLEWPHLSNPPIIMAIFQLKLEKEAVNISDFLEYDAKLRLKLPLRNDNIHANINMPATKPIIGVTKLVGTQNAEITAHTYFTRDQKMKLQLENNSILFIDETKYSGWDNFIEKIIEYLRIIEPVLEKKTVNRISMRFINQFVFDKFDDPTEYFTTTISSTNEKGLPFPISKYGFRMVLKNPKDSIYSIVNQNVETPTENRFNYIFDIDVLEHTEFQFDIKLIIKSLLELRVFKNEIFFQNLTAKALQLCN